MASSTIRPTNTLVRPILTDMYQLTMTYSHWKMGNHLKSAVFDLFFRKNPFQGEFTIFAGLAEVLGFLNTFTFTNDDIDYLRTILSHDFEKEFFQYLRALDCSEVKVYALKEGSVVFPRIPCLRVEGPIGICQLLETTLLNLLNYASLVATNAARFRLAAGFDKGLLEFGLRRAQGPDGAISASRYTYMGGIDGTSNVLAGKISNIPVKGTHAHSFVQAYTCMEEIKKPTLKGVNFVELVLKKRKELGYENTNNGELTAFTAYAIALPSAFLALVDTYDTLGSGVPNFITVGMALLCLGFKPVGIRLDSGDLSYLSKEVRRMFKEVADAHNIPEFAQLGITASNDINEAVLNALNEQGHEIDNFGIGTHLVTCQAQPALGMVFKLVQIDGTPRIKLSDDAAKVTIPGRKTAYRLIGANGTPILDLLVRTGRDDVPHAGQRLLCRHPFDEMKRVFVTPSAVVELHHLVWDGQNGGVQGKLPSLKECRDFVKSQVSLIRSDVIRPLNPTPYKVAVSNDLYKFIHDIWMKEIPIAELK